MKHSLSCFLVLLATSTLLADTLDAQGRGRGSRGRSGENQALAQPFKGVFFGEQRSTSLFPIKSTGVSTEPVRTAAETFLAGLTPSQREKTIFAADDLEWRKWDNRHFAARQGVGFNDMTEKQRDLAFGLMRAGLSARGLKQTQDIMKLNGTLAELTDKFEEYGEWLYWITIMGEPSATKPWGWQLDGHHVVINYFILGDQVVMSPVFMGSEPVWAESGKFKGTIVLQAEQNKGLGFINSLTKEQRGKAILESTKGPTNNLGEAYRDNLQLDYVGIPASELSEKQTVLLLDLIGIYAGNIRDGHAKVKMSEVAEHLDSTYLAWIGGTDKNSVFYYRIQSPVILIEFDHQRPIALNRSRTPTRQHTHTVVRTPNGNDYGKDLLRQHYQQHHQTEKTKVDKRKQPR